MMKVMAKEIGQIVCEYRTMFEDVAKTVPNIRPKDDVMYSSLDYGKILNEMNTFLEGYVSYRNGDDQTSKYDGKVIPITKKYYDGMFSDMSEKSPYRVRHTLEDMKNVNQTFLEGSLALKNTMESINENLSDIESQQLVAMTRNQYNKLARVYRDDMSLYLWLATRNSKTNPKIAPIENRMAFYDTKTPVMHAIDSYSK
jgi:hypothetical protein